MTVVATEARGLQAGYEVNRNVLGLRFIGIHAASNKVGVALRGENGVVIENCVIEGSTDSSRGGIQIIGAGATTRATVAIVNCTFVDNAGPAINVERELSDVQVQNVLVSSSTGSALRYSRVFVNGEHGNVVWAKNNNLFSTTGTVVQVDHPGGTQGCTASELDSVCDAPGDCNFDKTVAINEIIAAIDIALGTGSLSSCTQADANGDGTVTINELIMAVGVALGTLNLDRQVITVPPSFAANFHLAPGSPGRDQGAVPTGGFTGLTLCRVGQCDFDGHARPQPPGGSYDIGAAEGDAGAATDPTCTNPQDPSACAAAPSAAPAQGGAASAVTVAVGTATGCPGALVDVPVSLSGTPGPVAGVQIDLLYDPAVLSVADPNQPCVIDAGSGLPADAVYTSEPATGRLRVLVFDTGALQTFGDGPVVQCRFQIASGAPTGTTPVTGDRQQVSDADGVEVPSVVSDGGVTVSSCGC